MFLNKWGINGEKKRDQTGSDGDVGGTAAVLSVRAGYPACGAPVYGEGRWIDRAGTNRTVDGFSLL